MAGSVRRVVRIAAIAYTDGGGAIRRADHGDEVDVHADDVARFDSLNGSIPGKTGTVLDGHLTLVEAPESAPSTTVRTRRRNKSRTSEDSDGGLRNHG